MDKGAADSMSIVTILVYMLDVFGVSTSRVSARHRRTRKQIIEVTMTFKVTLSDTHTMVKRTGLLFSKDA